MRRSAVGQHHGLGGPDGARRRSRPGRRVRPSTSRTRSTRRRCRGRRRGRPRSRRASGAARCRGAQRPSLGGAEDRTGDQSADDGGRRVVDRADDGAGGTAPSGKPAKVSNQRSAGRRVIVVRGERTDEVGSAVSMSVSPVGSGGRGRGDRGGRRRATRPRRDRGARRGGRGPVRRTARDRRRDAPWRVRPPAGRGWSSPTRRRGPSSRPLTGAHGDGHEAASSVRSWPQRPGTRRATRPSG